MRNGKSTTKTVIIFVLTIIFAFTLAYVSAFTAYIADKICLKYCSISNKHLYCKIYSLFVCLYTYLIIAIVIVTFFSDGDKP